MVFGVPLSELLTLGAFLLAGGLVTGFLAGLLGIGGGGIIVPVLYELFRVMGVDDSVRTHLCVGTAFAVIIPTSLRSLRAHAKRGAVERSFFLALAPWVLTGVLAGIVLASFAPGKALRAVYACSTFFLGTRVYFARVKEQEVPKRGKRWMDAVLGFIVGLISSLVGIGGGVYITTYMTWLGWPIKTAVGTATGFGPIIAIPAAIGYIIDGWSNPALPPFSLGFISVAGALIVAPVSVLSAPWGVAVAHNIPRRTLEIALSCFLFTVATRFAFSLFL
jgi:uncharacterized protein